MKKHVSFSNMKILMYRKYPETGFQDVYYFSKVFKSGRACPHPNTGYAGIDKEMGVCYTDTKMVAHATNMEEIYGILDEIY